ncbi:hypothetical protein [uncultured Helicobacter sp.]|uniref:hypothetical protein n=1 Tax=uncultured Helicobacter sp. TaxID=175537 RepID=UPI002618586F|nr:hypothetical protein [uncultured Helicobacter sp.]
MKKTLKYFKSLEHTIEDILKELPDPIPKYLESIIITCAQNKDIKIEPFNDKIIANAKKIYQTHRTKKKRNLARQG